MSWRWEEGGAAPQYFSREESPWVQRWWWWWWWSQTLWLSCSLQAKLNVWGPGSIPLERGVMSFQIRGWHSSELLPFIWKFVTATWDHLQDIKAALSPHCNVNVSGFGVVTLICSRGGNFSWLLWAVYRLHSPYHMTWPSQFVTGYLNVFFPKGFLLELGIKAATSINILGN